MIGWPLLPVFAQLGAGLLVGLLVGTLHFASLALNLRLFSAGRVLPALALQLLRVGLSVALLAALIRLGLGVLLAGALGLLLARQLTLRRMRP
ncbi:F1/F0 ATPase, subunit 2 [Pseudomonas linyingensis]|uniref:F1/F0 ATPase, subunit 2 n=1 Tax=Pseudomonas linyingensis TaxID=915471 RepID=A0A1H7AGI0_9PSED|nr:ATP synthase subunit I [Pseudomonas linyingensis]SEJ61182.1 F1/F0 ATPase, subunit 2 [Pseudomonas linyingensis]